MAAAALGKKKKAEYSPASTCIPCPQVLPKKGNSTCGAWLLMPKGGLQHGVRVQCPSKDHPKSSVFFYCLGCKQLFQVVSARWPAEIHSGGMWSWYRRKWEAASQDTISKAVRLKEEGSGAVSRSLPTPSFLFICPHPRAPTPPTFCVVYQSQANWDWTDHCWGICAQDKSTVEKATYIFRQRVNYSLQNNQILNMAGVPRSIINNVPDARKMYEEYLAQKTM